MRPLRLAIGGLMIVCALVCSGLAWAEPGITTAADPPVDGGLLAPLRDGLHVLLDFLHFTTGSWGTSLIILALLCRVFLFPIARYGMRFQAAIYEKQHMVKPLVGEIKRVYADDTVRRNEEIQRVYKENGLTFRNQLKGLLPVLVQVPILIALYQLVGIEEGLKRDSFLWMTDLSSPDGYRSWGVNVPWFGGHLNILPILVFVSQLSIAQGLSGYAESRGRRFSMSMFSVPLVMLLLFYPFPSACMIYWATSSVCQAIEQRLSR